MSSTAENLARVSKNALSICNSIHGAARPRREHPPTMGVVRGHPPPALTYRSPVGLRSRPSETLQGTMDFPLPVLSALPNPIARSHDSVPAPESPMGHLVTPTREGVLVCLETYPLNPSLSLSTFPHRFL
ncbi:hypothetical protein VTK26DRAFT_2900 [Humicola hyalothermophila]